MRSASARTSVDRFHDLDAAALAAPAGMDLRFDDPDGAAEFLGRRHRLVHRECRNAARHRHARRLQNLLGLILMHIHRAGSSSSQIGRNLLGRIHQALDGGDRLLEGGALFAVER